MNFRKKSPFDLASRLFMLEALRKHDPVAVRKLAPNMVKFYTVTDDNNKEEEVNEIDWEYCIFEAPDFELGRVLTTLDPEKINTKDLTEKEMLIDNEIKADNRKMEQTAKEEATAAAYSILGNLEQNGGVEEAANEVAQEFEQAEKNESPEGMEKQTIDCSKGIPDLNLKGKVGERGGLILPEGFKKK